MSKVSDASMEHLKIAWANAQHNENLRNRLFQFYLVIAASFLVFFRGSNGPTISRETAFLASLFVWVIGFSFLWAYERIKEMIGRDAKITALVTAGLAKGDELERSIFEAHEAYARDTPATSKEWWSLSTCVVSSTSLISALVLSIGISHVAYIAWYWMIAIAIGVLLANNRMIRVMNFCAGRRRA